MRAFFRIFAFLVVAISSITALSLSSLSAHANACVVGKLEDFFERDGTGSGARAAAAGDELGGLDREFLWGKGKLPAEGDLAYTNTSEGYKAGRIVSVSEDGQQVVLRDLKTGKERTRDLADLSRSSQRENLGVRPSDAIPAGVHTGDRVRFKHNLGNGRSEVVEGTYAGASPRGYIKVEVKKKDGSVERVGVYPEDITKHSFKQGARSDAPPLRSRSSDFVQGDAVAFDLKPKFGGESYAGTFVGYTSEGALKFEVPKAGGGTGRIAVPREAISDRSAYRGGATDSVLQTPRPASPQTLSRLDEIATRNATGDGIIGNRRIRENGEADPIFARQSDRGEALRIGKIRENVARVDRLEPGSYTYIVEPNGAITVGRVESVYEAGAKHIQLADGKRVGVAGELKVGADGSVEFNVSSGSFSAKSSADNEELLVLAGDALKGASGNRAAVRASEVQNLLPSTWYAGPGTRELGQGAWGDLNRSIRADEGLPDDLPVFRQ